MGTEGAARQLRYAFLTDCAAAHGYDWIATAHTADDNAETLLLNLAPVSYTQLDVYKRQG